MVWSCNVAALALFVFACFGEDLGIVESKASREARLHREQEVRQAQAAAAQREQDIARQKIEDEARRKAQAALSADRARDARRSEMEAIEAAITKAESFPREKRHQAAKELSERVRQFIRTFGENDENLEWTGKIKSTRLRPLGH